MTTEGIDIVELPISPAAFAALRKHVLISDDRVTVYDLFPLSAALDPRYRAIAGQFLAAEALWALEEQGLLSGFHSPFNSIPRVVGTRIPRNCTSVW
jgi:hypothetical protein